MNSQNKRRMSRRHFLGVTASVAGLTALAACQPKEVVKYVEGTPQIVKETQVVTAVPAAAEQHVVHVFECCWDEEHIQAGKGLYRNFEEAHPNIKVDDFWPFGDPGWVESLLAKTAAGEPIDIIWWCASHHKFAEEGRLLDLQPLVDADTSGFSLDDYQQPGVDFCYDKPGRSGAMWGVPTNYASHLLWYNMDMFDAAGLDYPTSEWTWDNVLEAALALTKDTNNDGIPDEWGIDIARNGARREPVLKGFGGGYVDVDGGGGCLLTKPESIEGLQFLQDLTHKYKVHPAPADEAAMGTTAMFNSNKLAMLINPEWGLREHLPAHEQEGLRFGVALFPKGPASRVTMYWPGITSVTSQTKSPEAAWEVAKFIVGDQYQRTMTIFLPESPAARIETAMYGWNDYYDYPDDRSALIENPKYGSIYYLQARYGKEMGDIIEAGLDPVWLGEAKPEDVVGALCQSVTDKLAELMG